MVGSFPFYDSLSPNVSTRPVSYFTCTVFLVPVFFDHKTASYLIAKEEVNQEEKAELECWMIPILTDLQTDMDLKKKHEEKLQVVKKYTQELITSKHLLGPVLPADPEWHKTHLHVVNPSRLQMDSKAV